MKKAIVSIVLPILLLSACANSNDEIITAEYRRITVEEAKNIINNGGFETILDVRTPAEYEERRIEGSLLIPVDELADRAENELPDKEAIILVYCRAGVRSEQAARLLVDMGYVNVFDFGGLNEWSYETVSDIGLQELLPFDNTEQPPYVLETVSGELIITFDYEKISGSASNQYAIWIEDMVGNYINTIFATRWTAAGGYATRPDSIALWAEKADIASIPDYYVDAISGATPSTGKQSYSWNLKDIDGNTVAPGEYMVFVEGTLRWKNYVLFSGTVSIGNEPMTVIADAEYVYEVSDRYDALSSNSFENSMIGTVTASYVPADG